MVDRRPRSLTRRDVLRTFAATSFAGALSSCAPGGEGPAIPAEPWHVRDFATNLEVAGYVDRPSLNRGEDVVLHLNCTGSDAGAPVAVAVHRTGWYDGVGARTYLPTIELTAPPQRPGPTVVDPLTKRTEADWAPVLTVTTRTGSQPWPSGVYVIQLTARSGKQAYVPFTLRDDASNARVLVVQSQMTWSAYNNAGGHDLYNDGAAVSFKRPYITDRVRSSQGAGEYFWLEYRIVRWLERAGFDATYVADFDLHRAPVPPSTKAILFCGHPEYWTLDMRRHVEAAMETNGTGLVVLGANTCYWRGRLEDGTSTHPGNYVLWKSADGGPHPSDPLREDPELGSRLFRRLPGQEEQALLGGMFRGWVDTSDYFPSPAANSTAMVAHDTSHPVFAGTGISPGQSFPGLCGGEYDWADPAYLSAPPPVTFAFRTPLDWVRNSFHDIRQVEYQESTLHERSYSGGRTARVFNAGTYNWAWGLDDFSFEPYAFHFARPEIQTLTSNILHWAAKDV